MSNLYLEFVALKKEPEILYKHWTEIYSKIVIQGNILLFH